MFCLVPSPWRAKNGPSGEGSNTGLIPILMVFHIMQDAVLTITDAPWRAKNRPSGNGVPSWRKQSHPHESLPAYPPMRRCL